MRIFLEKAPREGYKISDEEAQILNKMNAHESVKSEFDRTIHNPIHFPRLYLSEEDYQRIYDNIVGNVLNTI